MEPAMKLRRNAILERIKARTEIVDLGHIINGKLSPCHIWTGPHSGNGRGGGYGRMSLDGQTVAVHLVAYTHFFGYIPSKKQVDHLCNNRLCWNPLHLELVTHLTNQRRRTKRKAISVTKNTWKDGDPVPKGYKRMQFIQGEPFLVSCEEYERIYSHGKV